MVICFYPGSDDTQDDENPPSKFDVQVAMPQSWTPKMYLAALLNNSTRKHSIVSLELITIDGQIYTTINELQWLFGVTEEVTHSRLVVCSASYIRVSGGILK
jgi:hypothetical protein